IPADLFSRSAAGVPPAEKVRGADENSGETRACRVRGVAGTRITRAMAHRSERGRTPIGSGIDQVQGFAHQGSCRLRSSKSWPQFVLEQVGGQGRPESFARSSSLGEE